MLRGLPSRHALPALVALIVSFVVPFAAGGSDRGPVFVTGAGSVSITVANGNDLDLPRGDVAFPIGSDGLKRAQDVAAAFWGGAPACSGNVVYAWTNLDAETNATASWRNPTDAWNNAGQNFDCRIDLNPNADYDFAKLCTVVTHEVGHLLGQQHAERDGELMSAIYTDPIQQCIDADPNPVAAAPEVEEDVVATVTRPKSTPKQMLQRILARRAAARRASAATKRCGIKRYKAHGKRTLKCRSARSRARAALHVAR